MISHLVLVSGLVAAVLAACPCSDPALCDPVQVKYKKEVFGFGQSDFESYAWDVVTTIAWVDRSDVMCRAHAEKTRVIGTPLDGMPFSPDSSVRAAWIQKAIADTKSKFLDGKSTVVLALVMFFVMKFFSQFPYIHDCRYHI